MKVVICIPTYNERESLPGILDRTRAAVPEADILVIDDNSPDGTGVYADERAAADSQINVLHRTAKEGLGRAYLAGFEWAIDAGYTHVCEMDADGSHRPEHLPQLLARADAPDKPDLVIGSRWVSGGEVVNWPKHREVLSRAGNLYIKLWLDLPAKDATAGFRVFRTDTLKRLDFTEVESRGYFFQVDMTLKMRDLGAKIVEVPISFVERAAGNSKMSGNIIGEAFVRATKLGFDRRSSQLKDFLAGLQRK
ncbi:polyprenol monophosphomannose synthase [Trueperella bialowiezensis]|uniref:Undecaprenyl-phosphate 4-deoxy-4-formamido-L-arabinose transferase n=1 Tax=Trueperella bialowiezensis TaxID=312285 RepID=A0A3S4V9A0_9ACTO|nr:polyprenol monophosphomannose synthase [Trueperella bialowiezensis]VEI12425.1 Undecaprenyl-phosphate 4-deoxy-4-formamido-L-arabinose transferase [Trueperella bialowiezensis]